MNAEDLYSALVGSAWKFAKNSMLDIDDIRQEMFLICMEVADGHSAYSPLVGGVKEYIMGRLWGLVLRWPLTGSIEEFKSRIHDSRNVDCLKEFFNENVESVEFMPDGLRSPSIEVVLEERDMLLEQDIIDIEESRRMQERMKGQTILASLVKSGHWSPRDAAKFYGVSRQAIEKRLSRQAAKTQVA